MDNGNGLRSTRCGIFGNGGRGDGECGKDSRWSGNGVVVVVYAAGDGRCLGGLQREGSVSPYRGWR